MFVTLYFSGCLHQMKVARLLKYLQFRDYKSKLLRSMEDDDLLSDTGIYSTSNAQFSFMTCRLMFIEWFVLILISCWGQSAAAATGPGLPHLDGSNRRLPLPGRAPGRRPH